MCLAVPGQVMRVVDAGRMLVAIDCHGEIQEVSLLWLASTACPVESWIGEWVTVHNGFATARIDAVTAGMLADMYFPP